MTNMQPNIGCQSPDHPMQDQYTPRATGKKEAQVSHSSDSDLRKRITILQLTNGSLPTPKPIKPPKTVHKRKRKDSDELLDEASTYSDDSWSTAPASDEQVKVGFIETKARDANGHIMDIKIPVYKKLRTGTSEDPSLDTNQVELIIPQGYKLTQCGKDE